MAKRRSARRRAQRVDVTWYGDDFLQIIEEHGDEALFAAGMIVKREADRRAPRGRTGNLRKSGYVSTATRSTYVSRRYWRREKKPPKGGATIGFSAPHAHLIEGGRRKAGTFGPRGDRRHNGVLRRSGKRALRIGNGMLRSRSRFRRMSSRPFLGPALEATKDTMVKELAGVLRTRLQDKLPRIKS
jgi:hypothetical protein